MDAYGIAARENLEGSVSLGAERKSALLCQLHDGPAIFAPALGGVQEPSFARRARVAFRGGDGMRAQAGDRTCG